MRILMMGTGPFAVPTFEALIASPTHEVAGLVTRPSRPAKGRGQSPVNPMREVAERHGLRIETPEDVNADDARAIVSGFAADLLVVCDYGQILSSQSLGLTPLGGINLHGSLLPKFRGAAPVNWALWRGATETGVTVIHMTPGLDSGPILATAATPIRDDDDAVSLEHRLSQLGVEPVLTAIDRLADWDRSSPLGTPQDDSEATRARRLRKSDGQVDWTRPARAIWSQVRALKPWPKTFTFWPRSDHEPLRLILNRVALLEEPGDGSTKAPGQVDYVDKRTVSVVTGDGRLSIQEVQPAGKRAMGIDEFLRGHPIAPGAQLG